MRTKKIFLASSSELGEDRKEFEILINRKNKDWVGQGVFLELIVWEDFLDAMSKTRLQDEYNKAIRECDVFVMLFCTKVGPYTEEEFETAFGQFQATSKPFIYTYFKDAEFSTSSANRRDVMSLLAFHEKLSALGHFSQVYKNVDTLKLHFVQQLDKLARTGFIRLERNAGEDNKGDVASVTNLTGSGAIAQGQGAKATGERAVVADRIDGPVITGDDVVSAGGHVVFAERGAVVVIGDAPVPMTAVDRESALGRYLQHVIGHHRYLQLQGIRSGGRLVNIELDRIYITLRATRERAATNESHWLSAEANLAPGERPRRAGPMFDGAPMVETVTVDVNEALSAHHRLAVLGDPGSGKTTLLRYLALRYARDLAEGTNLVREQLGLDESGSLPILLPLRRIGAFLRARRHEDDGLEGHAVLLEFLREVLKGERITVPEDFFDTRLAEGRAVVLLDGLDEVADPALRQRVSRIVESFTSAYPACRYVVTSRVVGYVGPARLGEGYVTTTVRDFTMADVERFLSQWHRVVAIGQMGPGEAAEKTAVDQTRQLIASVRASERVRELAINPLMLTVIAMVHRDRVKLPDRRAELYQEAVDVLLGKWDEAKSMPYTPVLPEKSFDLGDKRLILQDLALHMHEAQKKEIGVEALRSYLGDELGSVDAAAVTRFLHVIEERTGLLVARGEGVYAFSHLTFQEYLAALAVAARDDYVEFTLRHTSEEWWREVILLEAGYLSTQSKERTTRLIREIIALEAEPEPHHNLVLAAECLRDVGTHRVEGTLEANVLVQLRRELETPLGFLGKAKHLLTHGVSGPSPVERRIAAAEALGRVGGSLYWTQPYGEPDWVAIPAGEFWMGSEKGSDDEKPLHRVLLPEYLIARVATTNAQYKMFIQATGHAPPEGWEEGRPPKGKDSHPVVGVSWHDALAYCNWLAEVTGKPVTLPSEAEWEKAARGDADAREYPWGDMFDPVRCNCWELGLRVTTPVGIFAGGASPYGCLDMSGNVWEWTRSLWGEDWQKPAFAYPYDARDVKRESLEASGDVLRVLRGGSFNFSAYYRRAAFRDRVSPQFRVGFIGFRVVSSRS